MSTPTNTDELAGRLRVMQVIVGSLALGALAFLVVAIVIRAGTEEPIPDPPTLSYAALVIALVLTVAYHFVTYYVAAGQRRRITQGVPDVKKAWYDAYLVSLLAGAAVLEGAAFLVIMAYFIEGNWSKNWIPALAGIGLITYLVTLLPTRLGVEQWIQEQQELLKRDQAAGR